MQYCQVMSVVCQVKNVLLAEANMLWLLYTR